MRESLSKSRMPRLQMCLSASSRLKNTGTREEEQNKSASHVTFGPSDGTVKHYREKIKEKNLFKTPYRLRKEL